jgi:hypothetical protein
MKKRLTTLLIAACAVGALTACEVEDPSTGSAADKNPEASSSYTTAQNNAIDSAKSYLETGSFSRAGLIRQLSAKVADGYKRKDAVFAVNHIKVDWNKEAVGAAKSYLQMGGMSRDGLIRQLTSKAADQFTRAQAVYAANHVGL